MATSPSTTSGDDIHAGVNGSLVVLGDASTLSLVPFLRACRAGAAGTYRIRPELRYFTVVDTSAHERWARGGELGARERELDTRTLFLARSGDRMPHFATYAFFRPVGAARALAWLPRPVVGDYVIAHNLDALLARPAAGARAVGGDDGQGDGGGGADVELFAIGGQYFPADLGPGRRRTAGVRRRDGVNLLRARSLGHLANGSWLPWAPSARVLRPAVLLGDHAGCLDMMDRSVPIGQAGSCGFDGKFSIVRFRGRFWLYARANTRAMGGGRFVQVATSVRDDPAGPYGAFRLIQIAGYDPAVGAARSSPNIYFAAVNALPTDPSILLALFPVNLGAAAGRRPASPFVSRAAAPTAAAPTAARPGFRAADIHDGGAFLGVAASCDGVRFTRLERIAATTGVLGRTYDHPADGLILARGRVHFYVQRDVPGISPHADEHARIVRHSFRPDALARIVAHARATLEGCAPPPRAEVRKASAPAGPFAARRANARGRAARASPRRSAPARAADAARSRGVRRAPDEPSPPAVAAASLAAAAAAPPVGVVRLVAPALPHPVAGLTLLTLALALALGLGVSVRRGRCGRVAGARRAAVRLRPRS